MAAYPFPPKHHPSNAESAGGLLFLTPPASASTFTSTSDPSRIFTHHLPRVLDPKPAASCSLSVILPAT